MMKFIDRREELEFLNRKYKSNQAELIVLYGRRRIGKTELINEFLRDKNGLYFLGRLESREDTLKRINALFIEIFGEASLIRYPLRDWDAIFEYLGKKSGKRIVFVIDEFPFLVDRFPEIVSVIQDKWDNLLMDTKNMLILCGSSVSMMEKYTVDLKSPLYGRRTGQWLVSKLKIKCLGEFFPKYTLEELFYIYSLLDTIPGYLIKFDKDKSVWDNVRKKLLSKGEFLYEEVEVLLREELRDPSNYMSILSAIAGGTTTFNKIFLNTQLDKSLLSKYLYTLEKLGIIQKIFPVTERYKRRLKAKGPLYSIKDNFFDCWFRFVYLNKQYLERNEVDTVLEDIRNLGEYFGKKFEQFVMELISSVSLFNFTKIGKWWYKDKEIDIVALNEHTREVLFAECKWKEKVDAEKVLRELVEKSKHVEWFNDERKEQYAVFAKSFKFKKKVKEFEGKRVYCFDLGDLEKVVG